MADKRNQLAIGTKLQLESGSIYEIAGSMTGQGSGSIIYPARRLIKKDGQLQPDGFSYVVKECYPISMEHVFIRNPKGEIVPQDPSNDSVRFLQQAKQMQIAEGPVSQQIYRTASRMLPIREISQRVLLTMPGTEAVSVSNTVTVMESLAEKGQSLEQWIQARRRFTPAETFRIVQQLLFALREVHQAGFLHLDIQDGNIFLRGTLTQEEKSELITLIDFGSARATVNGKTAPIQDRMIFTCSGFSAPEILLHNDGTLQLGAEADLFSVGCLAFYLLTGHVVEVRKLISSNSRLHLEPNQLRRIKCPKHLTDRMQQILTRALETEPENRYHSAEEMLHDVTDLVDALQPYRTDLHAVAYDAFICYKHGPVDSAAALTLQRELEHLRTAKGFVGKRRPFRRVFVDEGELSSCADFGLQIREALKNSGWLIVICSPDTPLSPWVQLEIKTFLEYHDRSRILAVLTGGDETISFPAPLQAVDGKEGEILAADARGGAREVLRKLRGDAMLKIAAPMLGTTFDSLKQRQKLYLLQRIAAATAVFLLLAVAFSIYAIDRANLIAAQAAQIEEARAEAVARADLIEAQAAQIEEARVEAVERADLIEAQAAKIEEEYRNALINESRFLTEQAEIRLTEKDTLGAIELLLQALPSETQDRPVVAKAEYVLGQALNIYKTPSAAVNTVTATGNIHTENPDFFLNEAGSLLFTWDDYLLQAWDTETLSLQWEYIPDQILSSEPILLANGNMILPSHSAITNLDASTGLENWEQEWQDLLAAAASQDGTTLMIISGESGNYFDTPDTEPHVLSASIMSEETGAILSSVSFEIDGSQYISRNLCISPDLKWAAIRTVDIGQNESLYFDYNSLYLANLETGRCEMVFDSQTQISAMEFIDGSLAVMRFSGYNAQLGDASDIPYEINMPITYWLELYDLQSRSLLWSREQTDYLESGDICSILQVNYHNGQNVGDGLLCTYDDQCVLLDRETGRLIQQYRLRAGAYWIELRDNGFCAVNADGSISIADFEKNTVTNFSSFEKEITGMCKNGNMFYVQHNTVFGSDYTIHRYELDKSDASYIKHLELEASEGIFSWSAYGACPTPEGTGVILACDGQICLANLETGEQLFYTIPEAYDFTAYHILGVSEDGRRLYWTPSGYWNDPAYWIDHSKYYRIDLYSGEIEEVMQPDAPQAYISIHDTVYTEECLVFTASWSEHQTQKKLAVFSWDLQSGALTELYQYECETDLEQWSWETNVYHSLNIGPNGSQLYFAVSDNGIDLNLRKLIYLNLETGNAVEIPVQFLQEPSETESYTWNAGVYLWNRDGTQAVFGVGNTVYVVDLHGELLCSIPSETPVIAAKYTPDERCLLLIYENQTLTKTRIADGTCLDTLDLSSYLDFSLISSANWKWDYLDEATLMAAYYNDILLIDISDDTFNMKSSIPHCFAYDEQMDRFLFEENLYLGQRSTIIGSCPRYSLEDLIQMGNNLLQP